MSGTMSKYVVEEEAQCLFPNVIHCPVKCMSRSYAHMCMRFQDLEQSMSEMKTTLDTVVDYITRGSSSSSESGGPGDNKKAKKKAKANKPRGGSRSASEEPNIDQDLLDVQTALERDFTQLLTWRDSDDEGGKPKKPKRCQVILKSKSTSSNDGDTSEVDSDEHAEVMSETEASEIVRKVSQVIDDMAKVVDEIHVTAGIAAQVAADAAELQAHVFVENGNQPEEVEEEEEEEQEEEDSEPEFVGDFLALYNEMNEVD